MEDIIMQQLLPICKTGELNSVDARLLHAFLGSKQEFANWIKNRIEEYGFSEHSDFLTILSKSRGRPRTDYFISLDMAKQLAMVERTETGKQARLYFIECEKRLMGVKQAPRTYAEALRELLAQEEERVLLEQKLAVAESKAVALDLISASKGDFNISVTAKHLEMRPKDLFDWLQAHRWIFKRTSKGAWIAYQPKISSGLLRHVENSYFNKAGEMCISTQVVVTAKGFAHLARVFGKEMVTAS